MEYAIDAKAYSTQVKPEYRAKYLEEVENITEACELYNNLVIPAIIEGKTSTDSFKCISTIDFLNIREDFENFGYKVLPVGEKRYVVSWEHKPTMENPTEELHFIPLEQFI